MCREKKAQSLKQAVKDALFLPLQKNFAGFTVKSDHDGFSKKNLFKFFEKNTFLNNAV